MACVNSQDRKYRRAIEDQLMGKTKPKTESPSNKDSDSKDCGDTKSAGAAVGLSKGGGPKTEYYDPGTHWCKCCNFVAFKLYGYLEHLQTSGHMKVGYRCYTSHQYSRNERPY